MLFRKTRPCHEYARRRAMTVIATIRSSKLKFSARYSKVEYWSHRPSRHPKKIAMHLPPAIRAVARADQSSASPSANIAKVELGRDRNSTSIGPAHREVAEMFRIAR
jgi:hypothetical protein